MKKSEYELAPSSCSVCQNNLPFRRRAGKYCSIKCATSVNNRNPERIKRGKKYFHRRGLPCTDQHKIGISNTRRTKRNEEVEAGLASSKRVKIYLLERFGNRCMDPLCAWDFSKRKVDCQLDHINGDSTNNTLENCRLLCPSCHSLTPTFANKNRGNGRVKRRDRYHRLKKMVPTAGIQPA